MKTRRIRLIEPQGRPGRPFNSWITRWPLLGPITLATILEQRGYDVAVVNENLSGAVEDSPEIYADVCSADVVGISIMTPTAHRGYALARRIRQDAPQVTIVFGGVHATFMPEEALAYGDVVVRGEGESVIESIASGQIASGIVEAEPLQDLDAIPSLNHFLMRDFDRLLASCRRRSLYELPVMTSRGCPHGCTYCAVTRMFGRRVRRQSVDKVYRDVCAHFDRGFKFFFFYDDNFTTDRRWTRELLERLGPMNIRFNTQTRVDFHWMDGAARKQRDDGMLRAMRRAGANVLYIGYETIEDEAAAAWCKGYRGERSLESRLREDTQILHDNGFWIHAMFVMGPQHTARTAGGIVRFARRCSIETMQISILTPFPGTPLFEEMRPHLIFDDFPADWDYYDGTHCVYSTARMGIPRLQKAVLDAHRRFYRRGGWYAHTMRALASRRMPLVDKLLDFWVGIARSKNIFHKWRLETEAFLEEVRQRIAPAIDPGQM